MAQRIVIKTSADGRIQNVGAEIELDVWVLQDDGPEGGWSKGHSVESQVLMPATMDLMFGFSPLTQEEEALRKEQRDYVTWLDFVLPANSVHVFFFWDGTTFVNGNPKTPHIKTLIRRAGVFLDIDTRDSFVPPVAGTKDLNGSRLNALAAFYHREDTAKKRVQHHPMTTQASWIDASRQGWPKGGG